MSETTPGSPAVVSDAFGPSKATATSLAISPDHSQQPQPAPAQSSGDSMATQEIPPHNVAVAEPSSVSGVPASAAPLAGSADAVPTAAAAPNAPNAPEAADKTAQPASGHIPSHSQSTSASATAPAVAAPSTPDQTDSPAVSPPSTADTTGDSPGNPLHADSEDHKNVCANCGATQTPLWRRGHRGEVVCNACGLYLRARHTARPVNLKRPPRMRTVTAEGGDAGEGCLPGNCPGDGRCNGTGGSTACSQCPTFNNRLGKLHKTSSPPPSGESGVPELTRVKEEHDSQTLISCSNCGTVTTPLWRRDNDGNTICNACGLYYRLHHTHRQPYKTKSMIKRRKRTVRGSEEFDVRTTPLPNSPHPSHGQSTPLGQQASPHMSASPGVPVDSLGRVLQPQHPAQAHPSQAHPAQAHPSQAHPTQAHQPQQPPQAQAQQPQQAQPQQPQHHGVPGPAQSLMALSQGFPSVYPMYNMYPMMVPPGAQGMAPPLRPGQPQPGQPGQPGQAGSSQAGPSQPGPSQPGHPGQHGQPSQPGHLAHGRTHSQSPQGPSAQQSRGPHGTASAATSPTLNREQAPGQFGDLPPPPVDFTYSFRRDNSVEPLVAPQPSQPPHAAPHPAHPAHPVHPAPHPAQQPPRPPQQQMPPPGVAGPGAPYQSEYLIGGPAFAGPRGHVKRLSTSLPEQPSKRHATEIDSNSPLMVLKYLQGDSAKEYLLAARRHLQDKVEEHRKEMSTAQRHLFECEEKLRELE